MLIMVQLWNSASVLLIIGQGSTYAASEKKAKSNLAYQFKKNNNRMPASKITLPGELMVIN